MIDMNPFDVEAFENGVDGIGAIQFTERSDVDS